MTNKSSLPTALDWLRSIVAFAEEPLTFPIPMPPVLVETSAGLLTVGQQSLHRILAMKAREIELLQSELRHVLRCAAAGQAHTIAPYTISPTISKFEKTPAARRRKQRLGTNISVEGNPRDVYLDQIFRVLPAVTIDVLKVCPACGKAFIRITRKRFCSKRCQSRSYMREWRAEERAKKEVLFHDKKTATRARRRVH